MTLLLILTALFPPVAMYSGNDFAGSPYLDRKGNTSAQVLAATAAFDVVTLDVEPWTHHRPDVLDSLRLLNPGIRLLALIRGPNAWSGPADSVQQVFGDTRASYWAELHEAVASHPRGLIRTAGGKYGTCCANVNLADSTVSALFADVVARHVIDSARWDGVFFDHWCTSIAWQEDPDDPIDYRRAGHADSTSFFHAYREGHRSVIQRLRERAPVDFQFHGNCGGGAEGFDGWMVENFPHQNGGTWERNVEIARGGWISSLASRPYPYADAETWQSLRFGLGSACLYDAMGVLVHTQWDRLRGFAPWWADEYAVDSKGVASRDPADKHWLGAALSEPAKGGGVWRRAFEHGLVLVNPGPGIATVEIPAGYTFIRGKQDPNVNTGRRVTSPVTIPPRDARFLRKP